jgi:hypothetical protein
MAESNLRAATQRSSFLDLPNGEQLEFRPLIMRDWGTLEEAALKEYKRQWLQHKLDTVDILHPDDTPEQLAERKQELEDKAAAMTLDDCRDREVDFPAYDVKGKPIPAGDLKVGDIVTTRQGDKPVIGYMGGYACVRQTMAYVNWWLSRTTTGRFMSIWLSVRKARPTMTFDDCCRLFTSLPLETQQQAGDVVGDISKPTVGNG